MPDRKICDDTIDYKLYFNFPITLIYYETFRVPTILQTDCRFIDLSFREKQKRFTPFLPKDVLPKIYLVSVYISNYIQSL